MSLLKPLRKWFLDPQFSRKKQFLHSLEIFSPLKSSELGELIHALHARTYQAGEVIFIEGNINHTLFILKTGKVELTRRGPNGEPIPLYTLKPGDFFGEMALLESQPRTATATAIEPSRLHLLYRTKLDGLLQSSPRIGVAIMSHLAQLLSARLRKTLGQ
jgi:CRP-like cAMP-binding protein